MSRRLFTLVAAASLVLCVWAVYQWARSYLPPEAHVHSINGRLVFVFTDGGSTKTFEQRYLDRSNRLYTGITYFWAILDSGSHPFILGGTPPAPRRRAALGVQVFDSGPARGRADWCVIAVPYVYLVVAAALPPALWLGTWAARRRRFGRGRCVNCGDDLRESRERCPECGTAVPAGAGAGTSAPPAHADKAAA